MPCSEVRSPEGLTSAPLPWRLLTRHAQLAGTLSLRPDEAAASHRMRQPGVLSEGSSTRIRMMTVAFDQNIENSPGYHTRILI